MRNQTDELIEEGLVRLCLKMSFDKIRVTDILGECMVSKQTFYNHFRDKYDVAAHVYMKDMIWNEHEESYSSELLLKGMKNIWEKRDFYRNVLSIRGQNSLYDFIAANLSTEVTRWLRNCNVPLLSREEQFQLTYAAFGWVSTLLEWVKGNLSYSPEELAQYLFHLFPAFLTDTWGKGEFPLSL